MLSVYRNSKDTHGTTVTLEAVVERILDGKRGLDEKTRMCNVLASTNPDAYKTFKAKNLPAVTFSGMFPPKRRRAEALAFHSGFIVLDIDSLTPSQLPDLLAMFAQHPYVKLAFVSPSGVGIKLVVTVNPIPKNDAEHKTAWQACVDFFENEAADHGFEIDPSGKDSSRLCFLAHDPQAIVHTEPPQITWDPSNVYLHTSDLSDYEHSEADTSSLQAFLKSQDIKVLGTRQRGGFFVECLNRVEHTEAKQGKTDSFTRLCENGLIYHCSHSHCADKKSGWFFEQRGIRRDPFRKTSTRYTVNPDYKHNTSDIDTQRDANKSELIQWIESTENAKGKHMLILGSAAGTGKTTAGITTLKRLIYVGKTSEEADKVFEELDQKEEDVIRHRSRMYNYNHPDWETLPLGLGENDRPCIEPILCDEHSKRLGSPDAVCIRCPLYIECKESGYRSQVEKERNASIVVYAWNETFICDSNLASRLKRICTKDKVFMLDEANPLGFTQLRKMNRDMVYDLAERFRHALGTDHEIYQTLKALLDLISTTEEPSDFINGLSDWIDTIDDIKALDDKISKFPVSIVFSKSPENATHNRLFVATITYKDKEVTVPVVDFETGENTPVFFTEEPIAIGTHETRFMPYSFLLKVELASLDEPPRRYSKFLKDIKTFLDENRVIDAAPFTFDAKEQSFSFHLKPTLNHHRVIVNTASDTDNLITEAYRETDVNITRHTGTPPAWKTDLVFQIASGAYLPRHSLLAKDGKKLVLKKYAEDMIESFIKPSIQAGLKTLVIAPKAFQEVESVREWAVTDPDDYRVSENAILTNHHRAEGRNDYQDCDIVFEFHYEPNHNEIQADAKHLYRNPDTPLDFTREKQTVSVNGVEFKKTVYTDNRVQTVYNRECRSRLMQGPMRLRPNIHEGKTIVFLTAEPIDIPVTPVPFTPRDKDKFNGNWADFKEALQAKADAIESGDVQAVMEATGQSESTARRKTKASRDRKNAERDAQIIALHEQGKSYREIHTETGVSLGTVSNVVKAYKNSQTAIDSTYSSLTETVHPIYTDVPCVESETPHNCEVKQLSQTFPHLLQIGTLFFGKYELTAAEISQHTGYDESQVKNILESWYTNVCISKGLGESYWMSERDRGKFESEIIAPLQAKWESMPGHITTSEPIPENLQKRLREYSLQGWASLTA